LNTSGLTVKVGDVLFDKSELRRWTVKWVHGGKVGLRGSIEGMSIHSAFPLIELEAGRWDIQDREPATTQTGDNWTDDGESEAPSAMGADPSGEEEAGSGYMRDRDRINPRRRHQPIIDPASPPAGRSEITDRVSQPPKTAD
jgi:hypothetical protein